MSRDSDKDKIIVETSIEEIESLKNIEWNWAIEAAARDCDEMGEEARISDNIRKLKK